MLFLEPLLERVELGGSGLGNADIPVLVVNGANDVPYVDTADALVDALPNADLEVIPDTDHFTAALDARFKEAVASFLSANDANR